MENQPNNPLHGIKLQQIVEDLVAHYGWEYMGHQINKFGVKKTYRRNKLCTSLKQRQMKKV